MTPDAFRAALADLHWSQRGLALILGADDRLVRRWAAGGEDIPEAVASWLLALQAAHTALPVPSRW